MKILVNKQPVVSARMNMLEFEDKFREYFKLEKAFQESITIDKNKTMSKNDAMNLIFTGIDWGTVFQLYHNEKQDQMNIYVCTVKVEGLNIYKPKETVINSGEYNFEENTYSGEELIVIHSFVPLFEHHVEKFISDLILDYGHDTWKKVYEF